ncbi:UPF0057 membrane protein F47B7.1 [Aphelenchoides bicaudatus]|nr:UPF0057 membrane protein F47B7.1 [Aphelenchoides bicaudatus]
MACGAKECIWFILALLLPPLAVFISGNDCNVHVAINLILCFFAWIPGVIHGQFLNPCGMLFADNENHSNFG